MAKIIGIFWAVTQSMLLVLFALGFIDKPIIIVLLPTIIAGGLHIVLGILACIGLLIAELRD